MSSQHNNSRMFSSLNNAKFRASGGGNFEQRGRTNDRNGGGGGFDGGGGGGGGGSNEEFESWACESFNLIDYLGEDTSPLDEQSPGAGALNDDELEKQKEDALYSQFQYADMLLAGEDEHHHHAQQQQLHGHGHDFGALGSNGVDYTGVVPTSAGTAGFPGPGPADAEMDYEDEPPHHQHHLQQHHAHMQLPHRSMMYASSVARASASTAARRVALQHNLDHYQAAPAAAYVPSTSKSSMPAAATMVVKQEPISEHDLDMKMAIAPSSSRESSVCSSGIQTIVPAVFSDTSVTSTCGMGGIDADGREAKPRKYRIKPDSEKQNPVYRIKREKNNDAVRRSRDKAKRIQEAKENELKFLHDDNLRKAEIIAALKANNAQLQQENALLKQHCRCGASARAQQKR